MRYFLLALKAGSRLSIAALIWSMLLHCGGTVDELHMCQKLEGETCPTGLDMFLRKQKTFYLSGTGGLEEGEAIQVVLEHLPEPDAPRKVYETVYTHAAEDSTFTIPLKPGSLKIGSYQIRLLNAEEEFLRGLQFSVWNTQAEINARRVLGDASGAIITNMRICKDADKVCEESFHTVEKGVRKLVLTFRFDDAVDDSNASVVWRRNGAVVSRDSYKLSGSSGTILFGIMYENSALESGTYTATIVVDKSKQGYLSKQVRIK